MEEMCENGSPECSTDEEESVTNKPLSQSQDLDT